MVWSLYYSVWQIQAVSPATFDLNTKNAILNTSDFPPKFASELSTRSTICQREYDIKTIRQ